MAFLYKLIAVVDKKFSPNCSISKELLFRAECKFEFIKN